MNYANLLPNPFDAAPAFDPAPVIALVMAMADGEPEPTAPKPARKQRKAK